VRGNGARPADACADPEDLSRWNAGRKLFVDDDPGCTGRTPCFADIASALSAAQSGDTVNVLAGRYSGATVATGADVRITGADGPEASVITGDGLQIRDVQGSTGRGSIWVDHLTFRDCVWGVHVTANQFVDVRIQDNWLVHNDGQGAIGISSAFVATRIHVLIARNRIQDNIGAAAAVNIDLPADDREDYCVRLESNLITGNTRGIGVTYTTFKQGSGRFELVNNTIVDNVRGIETSVPSGRYVFVNNIFFRNSRTFRDAVESSSSFDLRHNLIDTGEFTGTAGNFADDPLFVDSAANDYHLSSGSPAANRGDSSGAPLTDITGKPRADPFDIGAYESDEPSASAPVWRRCGNSIIDNGPKDTPSGQVQTFESCDDGNALAGDGCSPSCQLEPAASTGQISMQGASPCVVRQNGALACWNDFAAFMPTGSFRQVAVSQYVACALDAAGARLPHADLAPTDASTAGVAAASSCRRNERVGKANTVTTADVRPLPREQTNAGAITLRITPALHFVVSRPAKRRVPTYLTEAWCCGRTRSRRPYYKGRSCHRRTSSSPRRHHSAATSTTRPPYRPRARAAP
jgi:cysteine-rich repeat protein